MRLQELEFMGGLLQLRGVNPSATPLEDAAGNVLLFNGTPERAAYPLKLITEEIVASHSQPLDVIRARINYTSFFSHSFKK